MSADKIIEPAFSLTKNAEPEDKLVYPVILYPVDTGPASDNEKVPLDEVTKCAPLSILKARSDEVAVGAVLIVTGNAMVPII